MLIEVLRIWRVYEWIKTRYTYVAAKCT